MFGKSGGLRALAAAVALLVSSGSADALLLNLGRSDLEHALSLARWPTTDDDRAAFHRRYIFPVVDPPVDYAQLASIEVISEFRRVELLGEEHARLNDMFGRAGVQEVEEAVKPWRGRMSLVAHINILPTLTFIPGVPPIDVVADGADVLQTGRRGSYSPEGSLVAEDVEAVLDSGAVGQMTRTVRVIWKERELGHAVIAFGSLE